MWWQTLPGVLTALTGTLGAIATLLALMNQLGWLGHSPKPATVGTPISAAPSTPPEVAALTTPVAAQSAALSSSVPEGSSETAGDLQNRVKAFVQRYLAVQRNGDVPDLLELYATQVDYFGHRGASRDFILKDKENYYRQWHVDENELVGNITVSDGPDVAEKIATFTVHFRASNAHSGKTSEGTASNVLTIRDSDGHLRIVGETQTFERQGAS